jgi:hypothetical protein
VNPSENLAEQIYIATEIRSRINRGAPVDDRDVESLADLVFELDEWLLKGGFLPRVWARAQVSTGE